MRGVDKGSEEWPTAYENDAQAMAPAGHPGTRAARAGTRARACGGRACARGGYRLLVCEVGRALAGQHGDERGLSVGKGGRERVSWSETGSGVFTFLRCVSDGPQSGHLDVHGRAGFLSGSAAQVQYLCAGAARWGQRDRGELREQRNAGAGIREPFSVGGRRRISIPGLASIVVVAGTRVPSHFIFQCKRGDPGAA